MCPPAYVIRPENNSAELPYQDWLDSAARVTIFLYSRHGIKLRLCPECLYRAYPRDHESFHEINRHYIHIGRTSAKKYCRECNSEVSIVRPIENCPRCPAVLSGFINYLRMTGDQPYNIPGATQIAISQTESTHG